MQGIEGKGCSRRGQNGISQHTDELVLVQKTSVQTVTLFAFIPGREKKTSP